MKRIWDLCFFEILRVMKKPQNYIFMFVMPLMFTLLFGSMLGGGTPKPTVAWVDQDHSMLSISLAQKTKVTTIFDLRAVSLANAQQLFKDKKVSGIITVKKDFQTRVLNGEKPTVTFEHGPEFSSAVAVKEVLNNTIDQLQIEATGAKLGKTVEVKSNWETLYQTIDQDVTAGASSVQVKMISKNKNQLEMGDTPARSAGFSILFVMIVMTSVTGSLLEGKKSGVWYRIMATPSSRIQILAGYFLSFFLIGWVQFGVLMLASSLLFGVHWGNIVALIVLVTVLLLAVVGLGLLIAGFVKTTEQQAAFGNIIVASTCMLGGVYWPLDIEPKAMQQIAQFVPQKWAMDGFTEIIARGGTLSDILMPVTVLLGFAIVFISVGLSRIKYE